ncbi:MAG: S-layer homology domain-containing protein, partial [Chloroflexota bacterium]
GTQWSVVPSPNPSFINRLQAVTAIAPDDAWAVGLAWGNNGGAAFILHWNGTVWSVVPGAPAAGYVELDAITAVGANDIWTVGNYAPGGDRVTMAQHWDGTQWTLVSSPSVPAYQNQLLGISAVTSSDIWAVGTAYTNTAYETLTLHWDGTAWTRTPSSSPSTSGIGLTGVVALAANDVWTTGSYGAGNGPGSNMALHWNGTSWNDVPIPSRADESNYLWGLAAVSPSDLWAVGMTDVEGGHNLIERYAGSCLYPTPTATPVPCNIRFIDMPIGHVFYTYVRCLACLGIVEGYPCGGAGEPCDPNQNPYFRPNNQVTRGQLSKIVAQAAGLNDPVSAQTFQDVAPASTFYQYIGRLAAHGIMSGYPCGQTAEEPCIEPSNRPYFRPGSTATRGQLTKIVSNAAGFSGTPAPGQYTFTDVPEGSTFHLYVERLLQNRPGVIGGYACGGVGEPCDAQSRPYFRPGSNVTRGQTSKIVSSTFFPDCSPPPAFGR